MLLMIDNYDSFTYNVVQYLSELGQKVEVYRNDEISTDDIVEMNPQRIVISPGPCTPNEAGISMEVIEKFTGKVPVLGICLGHQSIGQVYGARIIKSKDVMHGKTSLIHHDGKGVFVGLSNPFTATRYHSLVIDQGSVPDDLIVSAWTVNEDQSVDEIMGVRHKSEMLEGVQFHPESILTEYGHELLSNFLTFPLQTGEQ
jgi:anthranilate synthase component 2